MTQRFLKIQKMKENYEGNVVIVRRMDGKPTGNGCVGSKKATYLSQYESHESESQSRIRLSRSSKVMRKLKQLWNRQKYLTDDELESGLDQKDLSKYQESSPSKHIGCSNNWQQACDNTQVCKRLHSRAVSQGEEQMNVLRKITDQGEKHRDTVKSKALARIAALGSQAEESR